MLDKHKKKVILTDKYSFNSLDLYEGSIKKTIILMPMIKILLLVSVLLSSMSCSDGNEPDPKGCDLGTTISQDLFRNAPADQVTINSLEIENDCLKINFSASGCNGESWKVRLIDSGSIKESDPPQRDLRLSLDNDEMCEAFITRELSFNIASLKVQGGSVLLNLANSGDQILYAY